MVDNQQEQILATRKQIEEQQKQIEAAKRQVTPMKRVAFTPRKERESLRQYRSGLKESSRQIAQQQQEFETQVARAGIGIARPEIVEQQYKQATSEIQKQVNTLESGIKAKQDAIKRYEAQMSGADSNYRKELQEDIKQEQKEIRVLQAELGGWKSGLSGNKLDVVKKFFSGETKSIAKYQEQKTAGEIRAKEQKQMANRRYADAIKTDLTLRYYTEQFGIDPKDFYKYDPIKVREAGVKASRERDAFIKDNKIINADKPLYKDSSGNWAYQTSEGGVVKVPELIKISSYTKGLQEHYTRHPVSERSDPLKYSPPTIPEGFTLQGLTGEEYKKPFSETLKKYTPKVGDKIIDWYTSTNKYKATTIDVTDEEGNFLHRALIPAGELTKGERALGKIKETKWNKWITKSQRSEDERRQWLGTGGVVLTAATAGIGGLGLVAEGAGMYLTGKAIAPQPSEFLYGADTSSDKFSLGAQMVLSKGLKTYGGITAFGGLMGAGSELFNLGKMGGLASTKAGKLATKGLGWGLTTLYGTGKVKEYKSALTPEERQMFYLGTAGELTAFGLLAAPQVKKYISYRREFKNYNNAKVEYNKLKVLSKTAEVTYPMESYSLGVKTSNIDIVENVKNLKISPQFVSKIKSLEISQSTGKIVQKLPVIKKTPVPPSSELYNKVKNIYTTFLQDVTRYKNVVSYTLYFEGGGQITYSYVTFAKKPLPRFRDYKSALKYGAGKNLIITTPIDEGSFLLSKTFKYRAGKYTPQETYLSKMQDILVGTETKLGVVTKQRGKAADIFPDINTQELFEISPKVGEAIIKKGSKELGRTLLVEDQGLAAFDELLVGSRTRAGVGKVTLDTSTARKIMKDFINSIKKIKPSLRTNSQKATLSLYEKVTKTNSNTITTSSSVINKIDPVIQVKLQTAQIVETIPIRTSFKTKSVKQPTRTYQLGETGFKMGSMVGVDFITSTKNKAKTKTSVVQRQKDRTRQITNFLYDVGQTQQQIQAQQQKQRQKLIQIQKQKQRTKQVSILQISPVISPNTPIGIPIRMPKMFGFDIPSKRRSIRRLKGRRSKRSSQKYKALPTAFEAALGIAPGSKARKREFSGFEVMRFEAPEIIPRRKKYKRK